MRLLSVGLSNASDEIREQFYHNSVILKKDGYKVGVDETIKGNYIFLGFTINDGEISFRNYERLKESLKRYVAVTLTDYIMTREEKKLIRKIIQQNYQYFSDEEQDIIYNNALELLNNANSPYDEFGYEERRKRVLSSILSYLDTSYELVMDGFINFRLKDYRQCLEQIVDRAVDDFMMELEYQQFIQVLKYFVEIQEPRLPEVHVVVVNPGVYKLMDGQGVVINNQYFDTYITNNTDEINYEDLLISALITIAPQTIMIHDGNLANEHGLVDTLKSIFEEHVIECKGCDLCKRC